MPRAPERVAFPQILISSKFHNEAFAAQIGERVYRHIASNAVERPLSVRAGPHGPFRPGYQLRSET